MSPFLFALAKFSIFVRWKSWKEKTWFNKFNLIKTLLVVGMVIYYPKGPVDLFHEDHSHKFVGEGHLWEA